MTWQQWITLGVALVGAALGVINTLHSIRRERVRLRVTPKTVLNVPDVPSGIEIVNLSSFAVTLEEVGFTLSGHKPKRRAVITRRLFNGDASWPRRLEARESVTVYCDPLGIDRSAGRLRRAYVRTACGKQVEGWSSAMSDINERRGYLGR